MRKQRALAALSLLAALSCQDSGFGPQPAREGPIKVGPEHGTLVVVGGGRQGPEINQAFIDAMGGPAGPLLIVPNAGADTTYDPAVIGQSWRNAGTDARMLFARSREEANSDAFIAPIATARGIWFSGGRHYRLVDAYLGTRSQTAFEQVLARGGVVGGSSAGASILGDFLVRGAPSNDNTIMDFPGYENGFHFVRNAGIDQHVVARNRIPDIADSLLARYPTLLGLSEDEGTAWVIRGDTGRIIGRGKAFATNGADHDPGVRWVTLYPGDSYNLNTRRVISRASDRYRVTRALIDSLFAPFVDPAAGGATVLVAIDGNVLVDIGFGIPEQPRWVPRTTAVPFALGGITGAFTQLCAQLTTSPPATLGACVTRVAAPVGITSRTEAAADGQDVRSNVDELYRLALGLQVFTQNTSQGWQADTYGGAARLSLYAVPGGKRGAFVRYPERRATIIILTNNDAADLTSIVNRISDQLLLGPV